MSRGWVIWRDVVFWGALAAYAVNKALLPLGGGSAFRRDHFNDLLLVPVALPLLLQAQVRLRWREGGLPPQRAETLLHLGVWSVVCEWAGPRWLGFGTADVRDVVCYAIGALAAQRWWDRWNGKTTETAAARHPVHP